MKIFKPTLITIVSVLSLSVTLLAGTAHAESNSAGGVKLGFGFDRGFGLTGSMGKLNGFVGNDGVAVDYIFIKNSLKVEVDAPASWYIGAGGYGDWDGDLGVRAPVGLEVAFAERVDAYAHVVPRLRINHGARFGLDFGIGVRYQF